MERIYLRLELSIKCETKSEDKILFLVEGVYNGIFTIENANEEILDKDSFDRVPKIFISIFKIYYC